MGGCVSMLWLDNSELVSEDSLTDSLTIRQQRIVRETWNIIVLHLEKENLRETLKRHVQENRDLSRLFQKIVEDYHQRINPISLDQLERPFLFNTQQYLRTCQIHEKDTSLNCVYDTHKTMTSLNESQSEILSAQIGATKFDNFVAPKTTDIRYVPEIKATNLIGFDKKFVTNQRPLRRLASLPPDMHLPSLEEQRIQRKAYRQASLEGTKRSRTSFIDLQDIQEMYGAENSATDLLDNNDTFKSDIDQSCLKSDKFLNHIEMIEYNNEGPEDDYGLHANAGEVNCGFSHHILNHEMPIERALDQEALNSLDCYSIKTDLGEDCNELDDALIVDEEEGRIVMYEERSRAASLDNQHYVFPASSRSAPDEYHRSTNSSRILPGNSRFRRQAAYKEQNKIDRFEELSVLSLEQLLQLNKSPSSSLRTHRVTFPDEDAISKSSKSSRFSSRLRDSPSSKNGNNRQCGSIFSTDGFSFKSMDLMGRCDGEGMLRCHVRLVLETMGAAVESLDLDDSRILSDILIALGQVHAPHGIKAHHLPLFWSLVRLCLQESLQKEERKGWCLTEEVESTWKLVFSFVVSRMREGIKMFEIQDISDPELEDLNKNDYF